MWYDYGSEGGHLPLLADRPSSIDPFSDVYPQRPLVCHLNSLNKQEENNGIVRDITPLIIVPEPRGQ